MNEYSVYLVLLFELSAIIAVLAHFIVGMILDKREYKKAMKHILEFRIDDAGKN